jgi:hypothetical protein
METTFAAAAFQTQREDILALLPVSTVVEYRKGNSSTVRVSPRRVSIWSPRAR